MIGDGKGKYNESTLVCVRVEQVFVHILCEIPELDMIFPPKGSSGGGYFKAKDLVGTDGKYKLTMKLDGKSYGEWKFAVSGGKPVPVGRAARGKADPLSFVEGGRDAFWFEQVK